MTLVCSLTIGAFSYELKEAPLEYPRKGDARRFAIHVCRDEFNEITTYFREYPVFMCTNGIGWTSYVIAHAFKTIGHRDDLEYAVMWLTAKQHICFKSALYEVPFINSYPKFRVQAGGESDFYLALAQELKGEHGVLFLMEQPTRCVSGVAHPIWLIPEDAFREYLSLEELAAYFLNAKHVLESKRGDLLPISPILVLEKLLELPVVNVLLLVELIRESNLAPMPSFDPGINFELTKGVNLLKWELKLLRQLVMGTPFEIAIDSLT